MTFLEPLMASPRDIVHCYGQLASTMAQMVVLAQAKDWGALPAVEAQCAAIVDRLRVIEPIVALGPADAAEAQRLIAGIQSDQAIVNGLVKPQLERLMENMSVLQHRKSLDKAYGQAH
jgi:flagellar protein FliT